MFLRKNMSKSIKFGKEFLKENSLRFFLSFVSRRFCCVKVGDVSNPYLEFSDACDAPVKDRFVEDMKIHPDFITPEEEESLMDELEPKFRRTRYQFDHWDDAIHGYRETEKPIWNEANMAIIMRHRKFAFKTDSTIMPHVHVLDLAENGHIKPHLDSIKFCGDTITGISLLSTSIMKLTDIEKPEVFVCALLPRRSLYIMRDYVRYHFNHEILDNSVSVFKGEKVFKSRRVSVICRSHPPVKTD